MATSSLRIAAGDVKCFTGVVVNKLSVLAFLAGALIAIFLVPADALFSKIFAGATLAAVPGLSSLQRQALLSDCR